MSELNTLLKLLSEYKVEVPRIQRDYVQGRKDEHSTIVRTNLLKDIKNAFEGTDEPLDLNFVYGKTTEDKKFYPVDGQQRLTTLFLLHIVAFADDESKTDVLKKFSYEARTTTRDFFWTLVEHRAEVFDGITDPRKLITDAAWFIDSWKYDPSVDNAMRMIEDICYIGFDIQNLKSQLEEQATPRVFFQFVKLDELGMEDDLYIKLNARGRELTAFEIFKSRFVDRCAEESPSISEEINSKLDTVWADVIWNMASTAFDDLFRRFFENMFLNYGILKSEANKTVSRNWIYNLNYTNISDDVFRAVRNTLNYLVFDSTSEAYTVISENIKTVSPYPNKILFHAVCKYLSEEDDPSSVDKEKFADWMRVINNLVKNSRIEEANVYLRAISGINDIYAKRNALIQELASGNIQDLPGFLSDQFKEECQKARIMSKDAVHRDAILNAEADLPYFGGQIRSALFYSDLEKTDDISLFEDYIKKIAALFSDKAPLDGILLRRALCSISDYRMPVGSYSTLCIDDPNESSRTPSIKKLFSSHGETVKALLDAIDLSYPIEGQLEALIHSRIPAQTDWRYCLINYPELFEKMSPSHLRMCRAPSGELLVPNKQSSGNNYSIHLCALEILLKREGIVVEYECEAGAMGERHLSTKDAEITFDGKVYSVKDSSGTIWKNNSTDIIDEAFNYIKSLTD